MTPYGGPDRDEVAPGVMAGPKGRRKGVPGQRHDAPDLSTSHDCTTCGKSFPIEVFAGRGYGWTCPDCRRKRARRWDRANRQRESDRRKRVAARRRARVELLERVLLRLARADPARFAEALEDEAGDLSSGLTTLGIGDKDWRRR